MSNGALESHELTEVEDGLYLSTLAASGWIAMREACKAATGVELRIARPHGAYRSLVAQRVMYNNRHLYPVGIAKPGSSTHGLGMAADATLPTYNAAREWLLANCTRFGFQIPPTNDRNHFAHRGTTPSGGLPIMATVEQIWGKLSTVVRGKAKPTVLQEIASTRTIVERTDSRIAALETSRTLVLSDADIARIAKQMPAPATAAAIATELIAQLKK